MGLRNTSSMQGQTSVQGHACACCCAAASAPCMCLVAAASQTGNAGVVLTPSVRPSVSRSAQGAAAALAKPIWAVEEDVS